MQQRNLADLVVPDVTWRRGFITEGTSLFNDIWFYKCSFTSSTWRCSLRTANVADCFQAINQPVCYHLVCCRVIRVKQTALLFGVGSFRIALSVHVCSRLWHKQHEDMRQSYRIHVHTCRQMNRESGVGLGLGWTVIREDWKNIRWGDQFGS